MREFKKYLVLVIFLGVWLFPVKPVRASVSGQNPAVPRLSAEEMTLAVGKSKVLAVDPAEDGSVLWSSSDEKIASVTSAGKVTGVSGGRAVITASVNDLNLKCQVTVKSLGIKEGQLSMNKGGSYKLSLEKKYITGNVTWKSTDRKIAGVTGKGKVMARKYGTVTITAKADGCTASCKVRVVKASLSESQVFIGRGQTKKLSITGTSKKVKWSSNAPETASVNSKGTIRAKKEGNAVITAKIGNILLTCKVTVTRSIWNHLMNQYRDDGKVKQLLFVKYTGGTKAKVMLYQKENKKWKKVLSCAGYVGKNGIGQTVEGVPITPTGTYNLTKAFGILKNPGAKLPYLRVNQNHYWCGDDHYYNQLIDIRKKPHDCAGEHLIDYVPSYYYGIFLDYNKECVKGKGSAIFLHCKGVFNYTEGCISVSKQKMIQILQNVEKGAKICIYAK